MFVQFAYCIFYSDLVYYNQDKGTVELIDNSLLDCKPWNLNKQREVLIMYTVYGYEKDSDIYDEIGTYRDFYSAITVAKYLCFENTRRKETQPYDWFLIEISSSSYRRIVYKNKNNKILFADIIKKTMKRGI